MLETEKSIGTFLRVVGFFFLAVGVFPSIILTTAFTILSILTKYADKFLYLHILSIFYVISGLGYFFVVTARNLEKRASS